MPTIHDLKQSRFLAKSDVTTPKLLTISGYRYINVGADNDEVDNQYVLDFADFDKPMVLKPINGELIAAALGQEDFNDWIGKQIVVYVDPNVTMKGKVVGGIRCRARRNAPAPATPKPAPAPVPPPAPAPVAARPAPEPAEPAADDAPF